MKMTRNVKKLFVLMSVATLFISSFLKAEGESKHRPHYLYDSNHVRYELYQTNGKGDYNWLFVPGGPGADSCYFYSLLDLLDLPGNVWLVDLPGNGSNACEGVLDDYDQWFEIFPSVVEKFKNPILVGHSFGGMFPLFFPELENQLKGLVILNSVPSLWLEEAHAYSRQFDLPDLKEEIQAFAMQPSQKTFEAALDACMPYYFPKETLEQGRALLTQIPFQYLASAWWQRKAIETDFSAAWIPEKVPTLIVGAKYDCICPYYMFQKDKRFHRENISMQFIEDGGHVPWVENPKAVVRAFHELFDQLESH